MPTVSHNHHHLTGLLVGLVFVGAMGIGADVLLGQEDAPLPPPSEADSPGYPMPSEGAPWGGAQADGATLAPQSRAAPAFAGGLIGLLLSCFLLLVVGGLWVLTFIFALLAWREARACRARLDAMAHDVVNSETRSPNSESVPQ